MICVMCQRSLFSFVLIFTDDTNIFFSHKNVDFLEKTLNEMLLTIDN